LETKGKGSWPPVFFKVILYILNTLFLMLGIAILGLGAWAVAEGEQYSITTTVAVSVIVLGAVIFLISFFGCFGTWKVNKCILYTYAFLLLAILIILLVIGIVAFLNEDFLKGLASDGWNDSSNDTRSLIETRFNCCGFHNTTDRPYANGTFNCSIYHYNISGCEEQILSDLNDFFTPMAAVGFTLVGLMLIGIIFAIVVACKGQEE